MDLADATNRIAELREIRQLEGNDLVSTVTELGEKNIMVEHRPGGTEDTTESGMGSGSWDGDRVDRIACLETDKFREWLDSHGKS